MPLEVEYPYCAVKRSRQFGALVLLLVWSLVPAMACTVPDAQMTQAERDCCVQMRYHCGDTSMPASHGCCQKQLQTDQSALVFRAQHLSQSTPAIQALPAMRTVPAASRARTSQLPNTSPPQSPPSSVAILRI